MSRQGEIVIMTQSSRDENFGRIFSENRVPIALIGVGIAWLLANRAGLMERVAKDERVQAAKRRIGELGALSSPFSSSKPGSGGQILGPSGEPLLPDDMRQRNGWVHQAAGAARGAIGSVRDASTAAIDRASSSITGYAGDAGDLAKRASDQVAEKLGRDPWLIGIVGFVGGALLAAVLPPTQTEQNLVGQAQGELRNRAAELGHEAAARVRELADAAIRPSPH
jgi:hypothetical protein